jgi:superfamily I DNA and/or RNA helicase
MLEKYEVPQLLDVSIDTVERFQGSQRDVILYGTTVKKEYQLGFLSGNVFEGNGVVVDRKLNVAVSRSREQMIVVGNVELLSHSRSYLPLISYLKEKNGVISF